MSRQGAALPPTNDNIKRFWEKEAGEWGDSPRVTIRDHYFRIHELHLLSGIIPRSKRLLDIGCGTGFGTLFFARRAEVTVGLDFSQNMVDRANRLTNDAEYRKFIATNFSPLWPLDLPSGKLQFVVGDILNIETNEDPFDVISGQRILINLPTHEEQMLALSNLRRIATPGAQLVLVEATQQGHQRTDLYRNNFGLPPLEKYWHNNYLDASRTADWLGSGWQVERVFHFETYSLLSKVIYPAACGPENCEFLSGANAAAMEIANTFRSSSSIGELSIKSVLDMWVDRVRCYDPKEAISAGDWVQRWGTKLPDWRNLGHQELFIARAI